MGNQRNNLLFSLNSKAHFNEDRFDLKRFPGLIAGSTMAESIFRSFYDISLPTINIDNFVTTNTLEK